MQDTFLYTRYPIVARALGLAAFMPSAPASKGILHTRYLCSRNELGLKATVGQARCATIGYLIYN